MFDLTPQHGMASSPRIVIWTIRLKHPFGSIIIITGGPMSRFCYGPSQKIVIGPQAHFHLPLMVVFLFFLHLIVGLYRNENDTVWDPLFIKIN